MALEHLEPRWNPTTGNMTTFQFDVPVSVANLGVQVGVYSNTDGIYLAGTLGQQTFQTIPSAPLTGSSELQLITLVSPGNYLNSQSVSLAIPYPANTFPNNGEFRGGELFVFVGNVVNGLPIAPGSNSVGAPTATANPSTNIAPNNYAQIELTYIPQGNGAGLDIDSSSVDNVGFPFTLTYPTSGLGSSSFPINPLGITLSQENLYSTFYTLVKNGTIPREFQQSSTFNQQQDSSNIQIVAPGDILSHNATAPIINSVNQVSTLGTTLDANYNYFYVITAYSDNVIESYNLNTSTGAVTDGNSGVRGETLLSNFFNSGILASGKSNQINWSPYLDPNTVGYNIYRFSTPDSRFTPNSDTVYNLIAQIPNNSSSSVSVPFSVHSFLTGATTLTPSSTNGLSVGMKISGVGIAPNTTIQAIGSNGQITISIGTSGAGGGSNSLTATSYQFLDTGSISQAKQISGSTASSYGFNPLSEYYTEELLEFFSHYLTPNSFALTRSNVEWAGNTVLYAPAGSWNISNSNYMALQLTAQNGDGSTIAAGDVLNVYAPFFQTNTRYVTINNNPLPQMPSWLSLADVNGVQGIGNLYESPSQMVFGCDSVFASNGLDPDIAGATSALGTYLGSIEDSIAAAFNRGIASNLSIQPDNWASFPAISGNPIVSTSGSSQITNEVTYYYAVTAINVLGESTPSLVVPATLIAGQVATINWTQNPNPVPPSLSYNIYRGTTPDISQMGLLLNVGGNTLTLTDIGAALSNPSTHPPFQYYAADSTSNWYSYFTQTNSSVDPVNGVSINGLSYGFAYADQGGLSTNAFFSTGNFPASIGVHMGLISGPEFITQLLADATQSQPYSQQIQVSGNVSNLSYSLASGSLPAGLTLNANTGIISGTPTATAVASSFTIRVSGKENNLPFASISRLFTLTVNSSQPASQALTISGLTVPSTGPSYLTLEPISLGAGSYTRTISVTGGTGPYTLTPTNNIGTGQVLYNQFPVNVRAVISSFNNVFTLTTVNPLGLSSGLQSITFEIKDAATPTQHSLTFQLQTNILPALTITVPTAPTAYVGVPYYQKLQTNQNPTQVPEYPWGELTYSLATGSSLPPGLTLTPWGVIQGTPTTSSGSPFSYTVQVTNQVTGIADTATAGLSMNVQPNINYTALAITNPGTLLPVLGTTYNAGSPLATIATTGGSGGVQLVLINGQLPAGLSFNGTQIIGSVTVSSPGGDFPVTFRAIDIQGHIAYQNVTISVLSISPPPLVNLIPIPYDIYQATNTLIIPGTGFNASTLNSNVLTVNATGSIATIRNGTTLNQLVADLNTGLTASSSMSLQLAVNNGASITSPGYANIRSNPTITQSMGNLALNSSTLLITGTNFGTGNTGSEPFGGYRYFIHATNEINEAQLILTDSSNNVIPFTSIGNGNYSTTMEISGLNLFNAAAGALNAKLVVNGQTIFASTQVGTIVAANAPQRLTLTRIIPLF